MDTIEIMLEGEGLTDAPKTCEETPKLWSSGSAFYAKMLNSSITGQTGYWLLVFGVGSGFGWGI